MQAVAIREAVAQMRAGYDALAALPVDALTHTELLPVLDELEALTAQLPTQRHRMLARLQTETTAKAMGAKSFNEVLRIRWRMTTGEAGRRLAEAADLAPRSTLTGERLDPVLPATATAQTEGMTRENT